MSPDPVDATKIPYVAAALKQGSCTAAETKAIPKYLDDQLADKNVDFTQEDWAKAVSEDCAKCIFTERDATSWGVIINDKSEFYAFNFGGCIQSLTGNEACGQAVHQAMSCAEQACANCETTQELEACLADRAVVEGPCSNAVAKIDAECDDSIGQTLRICDGGGLETWIEYQCGSGPPKSDAGTRDAGGDGG
ncbi:MAG TPA: hypothetical protein VM580_13905 [Labilithrix sp.]|nr:hypothetical protein [Labilithrix sp.]